MDTVAIVYHKREFINFCSNSFEDMTYLRKINVPIFYIFKTISLNEHQCTL